MDLTGRVFGRWTVLVRVSSKDGNPKWRSRCECGVVKEVYQASLLKGLSRSCGCLRKELRTDHGQVGTPEYDAWRSMWKRCREDYGGRYAARIPCDRWKDYNAFIADMGPRPDGYTLERIDNNLGYFPGNCEWATQKKNARNRSTGRFIAYNGQTKSMIEWSECLGINYQTLRGRLNKWSIEKAMTYEDIR